MCSGIIIHVSGFRLHCVPGMRPRAGCFCQAIRTRVCVDSELGLRRNLSPSGISRSVDRLTKLGLVERATNPDDGRSLLVRLTANGLRRLREAQVSHHRIVREMLLAHFDRSDLSASASSGRRRCRAQSPALPGRSDLPAADPPFACGWEFSARPVVCRRPEVI